MADPSAIVKLNGVYHVWGTGTGVAHAYSSDLVNWTWGSWVFPSGQPPSWVNNYVTNTQGEWAPYCVKINGTFYLYYACSTQGGPSSCIGLVTSTDLINWTDQGVVIYFNSTTNHGNTIDPCVYQALDGTWWLTYGSYGTGIWTTQINPTTGKTLNSNCYNISAGNGSNSRDENSVMIPHAGYYYLFNNRGSCCAGVNSTYYIVVGRSTSPIGPFLDKNNNIMLYGGGTTFLSTSGKYIGPGSLGDFIDDDGTEYASYFYYNGTASGAPTLALSNMQWGTDGWPISNPNWFANGTYKIQNQGDGLNWDAGTGASLQPIVQNTPSGSAGQLWNLAQLGYGAYEFTCGLGGLSSDVLNCAPDAGSKLDIYGYWGGACQQWQVERYGNGSYVLESQNGGNVAEVPNATSAPGTQLQLFSSNGYWGQQWNIMPTSAPAAPASLTPMAGSTVVYLAWTPSGGATGYNVYMGTSPGGESTTPIATGVRSISYTAKNLTNGTTYYFTVKAVNSIGMSGPSNETSLAPGLQPLSNGTYQLIPACAPGSCLDAYATGTANGTKVDIWGNWGGSCQKWTFTKMGDGSYKIQPSYSSTLSLETVNMGTSNGTAVDLWGDWGGPNQRWFVNKVAGGYWLAPENAPGQALNVSGNGSGNGTNVLVWQWGGQSGSLWTIR